MKRVIQILKDNGFSKIEVGQYTNKDGILFMLNKKTITVISWRGDLIDEFYNVKYNSETNYLIVGFLFAKGLLKQGYQLPEKYQIG